MVEADVVEAKKEAYLMHKGFEVVLPIKLITTSDLFAIFGARGMAAVISRSLERAGYNQQLKPTVLSLIFSIPIAAWFSQHQPRL